MIKIKLLYYAKHNNYLIFSNIVYYYFGFFISNLYIAIRAAINSIIVAISPVIASTLILYTIKRQQEKTSVYLINFKLPCHTAILYRTTANIGNKLIIPTYVINENVIIKRTIIINQ